MFNPRKGDQTGFQYFTLSCAEAVKRFFKNALHPGKRSFQRILAGKPAWRIQHQFDVKQGGLTGLIIVNVLDEGAVLIW